MGFLSTLMGAGNLGGAINSLGSGLFGGITDAITNATSVGDGFKRFGKSLLGGLGNALGSYFGVGGQNQDATAALQGATDAATSALTDAANQAGVPTTLTDLASQGIQYGSSALGDLISQGLNKLGGVTTAGGAAPAAVEQAAAAAAAQPSNLPEGAAMIDPEGVGGQVVLDPAAAARKKVLV